MSEIVNDMNTPAAVDVFELAAVGMLITDPQGRFVRVNPAFCRLLRRSTDELLGSSFASFALLAGPDDVSPSQPVLTDLLTDLLSRPGATARFEQPFLRPDGSSVWVDLSVRAFIAGHDRLTRLLIQGLNITERKRADQAAVRHRRQLEDAQRIAAMGSFEQLLPTGSFVVSDELCRITGLASIVDIDTMIRAIHPDDRALVGAATSACIGDHTPSDIIHRMVRPDGTLRWVHTRAAWSVDEDGQGRVVGTVLDITDIRATEDALAHQAFHDSLTGLANKALFVDRLGHALQRGERDATPVGVLFIDIDDFKTANDALGHASGDELLIAVGRRVAGAVRMSDTVARFGGDDFAVLLESGEMPHTAQDIAVRITDALHEPFRIDDTDLSLRASIGAAVGYPLDPTSDDLLRDADLAMYLAKKNGKDRFEMFHSSLQDSAQRRLTITTELRHALEHHELEVFYQPIVHALDSRVAGAEAVVRWHHPDRGLILPVEFIGIAESTGLIVQLGAWILDEACRQTNAWRNDGVVDDAFYISVNVAARQLAESTVVDDVARVLRTSGLPPRVLVLEITETAMMLDVDIGLARLHALKALGLRLALDDYGTGYSSLNRLGTLPVDIVKIDKSFVDLIAQDAVNGSDGTALVRSVIEVTNALGLTTIAEGVEQPGQRDILAELGCHAIQGHLFAPATPPAETALALVALRRDPDTSEADHPIPAAPR